MSDSWEKREFIEGEYKVLDERDFVDESDHGYEIPGQDNFLDLDPKPPYVTYIFLGINIAAYILMSIAGFLFHLNLDQQLLIFGAKVNILIAYGQYWRLLTAMFLHVGALHLLFNSYALYNYGPIVERLYGKAKFAVIYILSGLMGSLFSYVLSENPAAGASGAIFGLMGSLLYFRQRKRSIFQRVFGTGLFMVIFLNLFYGFIQPGIDNWGHIGGLLGGYLVGNAIGLYKEKKLRFKKLMLWVLIAALFVFGIGWGQEKYIIKKKKPGFDIPRGGETLQVNFKSNVLMANELPISDGAAIIVFGWSNINRLYNFVWNGG